MTTTGTAVDLRAERDATLDAFCAARDAALAASDDTYAAMQARSYAAYLVFAEADAAFFDHQYAQNGN